MDQLNRYFAGNPTRPVGEEFDLMVETWTVTLQDVVPEYRLPEAFIYARQNRATAYQLDVSEICTAWNQIKAAEKVLRPTKTPGAFAKDVCIHCNGTGTRLFKKMDFDLGREYTYGKACTHE